MGHSYHSLCYHIVFSTKERRPLINSDLMPRLIKFTGGMIRQRKGKLLSMNGTEDHVHILAVLSPTQAISEQVRDIKALSSGWIKGVWPNLKHFAWQEGYSAFTVGKKDLESATKYIQNQQKRHRRKSFAEELVEMLERAGIEYDRKYLFD